MEQVDYRALRKVSRQAEIGRPPALPFDQRLRVFLASPEAVLEQLGAVDVTGRESLQLFDEVSRGQQNLSELSSRLIPLIERFREPGRSGRFMGWFTGQTLERELSFPQVCAEVEAAAERGIAECEAMRGLIDAMRADRVALDDDIVLIEDDCAFGEQVLAPRFDTLRAGSGVESDTWLRLSRRVSNLSAIATSMRLTQKQYDLTIEAGLTMIARFEEIRTLLMPIWYQRMGFQLLSRRRTDIDQSNLPQTTR